MQPFSLMQALVLKEAKLPTVLTEITAFSGASGLSPHPPRIMDDERIMATAAAVPVRWKPLFI